MITNLTNRQKDILKLINRFGYVNESLMGSYLDLDTEAVKKVGQRLFKRGLIRKIKVLPVERQYWLLDKLAVELLSGKFIYKVSPTMAIHNGYVYTLAIDYLCKGNVIKLERELRQELDKKFGVGEILLPDLLVNNSISIEIELSFKTKKRILKKAAMYNYNSRILEVIWISNKEHVLRKLKKIVSGSKHKFYIFDEDILQITEYIGMNIMHDDCDII